MKNSFLIMDSWVMTLSELDDATAGKVIKAACEYQTTGDMTSDDVIVKAIFAGWRAQMDANNEAYEEMCRVRSEAGRKGAEARWQNGKAIANDSKGIANDSKAITNDGNAMANDSKHMAKMADNDNDTDNDINNIYYVGKTRPPIETDVDDIIEYLNKSTHKHFRLETEAYRKVIRARLKDGYTIDDFRKVIDSRVLLWGDSDRMSEYLRPQTLFTAAHFDSYLNEADKPKEKPPSTGGMQQDNKFQQYEQRTDYDFDALERMLTAN